MKNLRQTAGGFFFTCTAIEHKKCPESKHVHKRELFQLADYQYFVNRFFNWHFFFMLG